MVQTEQSPPATPAGLPELSLWLPLLRDSLEHHGRFVWPLRGASMQPTLPPDCEITIVPLAGKTPLGSLIVFAGRDSAWVVHRLVHRSDRRWVAQGDARVWPDPWLDPAQILGRVSEATIDGRRIWPGRLETLLKWFWIGRADMLWLLRRFRDRIARLAI